MIEHVPEPIELLEAMEGAAGLVLVNLLEPKEGESALHHELPIGAILARARARGLVHYRRHHGSSHLVAYGAGRPPAGLRSRAALRAALRRPAVRSAA